MHARQFEDLLDLSGGIDDTHDAFARRHDLVDRDESSEPTAVEELRLRKVQINVGVTGLESGFDLIPEGAGSRRIQFRDFGYMEVFFVSVDVHTEAVLTGSGGF